jgi:hypothetical protein
MEVYGITQVDTVELWFDNTKVGEYQFAVEFTNGVLEI